MHPIKRRARLYIFLIIVFSFLLGLPYHTLSIEVVSVQSLFKGYDTFIDYLKIILLIVSHLMLISLLFIKESTRYKRYLILFPLIFVMIYAINAMLIYMMEPRLTSWFLPYFVAYGLAVYEYTRYEKAKA